MDFKKAIENHCDWKIQFRAAINRKEKMDVATIASDNCCELGRWLENEGHIIYGYLESFKQCTTMHTHFHHEAAKVAQQINAEHFQEAEVMMDIHSEFDKASRAVNIAIIKLRAEALVR
ncbi:MAG: CZB domain-containing protein [Agitococcus sp.]|nr:CZB domain-containing protein [Agitococcus sp.]